MKAFYNEIDPFCCAWLSNLMDAGHITPGRIDDRPIQELSPDDVMGCERVHYFAGIGVWDYALNCAGWADAEVWTGSCPCQPFSASGKKRGFADERHVWPDWFSLIRECRPNVVFGEQVSSSDGLIWFDLVSTDMENEEYAIGALDTCAAGVGAPHIRQRLYFVAESDSQRREGVGLQLRQRRSEQEMPQAGEGCETGVGLADANGSRSQGRRVSGYGSGQWAIGSSGLAGELADPNSQRDADNGPGAARETASGMQDQNHALYGFWSDVEWIPCRDGKWRPVEPGVSPLVAGTPNRVGRLRGYGNALNAAQAQAFIESYMETRP